MSVMECRVRRGSRGKMMCVAPAAPESLGVQEASISCFRTNVPRTEGKVDVGNNAGAGKIK